MGNDGSKSSKNSEANTKLTEEQIELLMANTPYTHDQIVEFHRKFLKICPSGVFDRKSFVEFFSELRPDKDGELLCKQMFNAFDRDNSGRVDFNEFLIAISLTSDKFKDDPKKKLEFAFNMYDTNRDQKLSLKEIEEIVAGIYQFTGQDESSRDVKKPSEVAKYMLAKYDKDANGYITKDEFLNGIIVDPTLQALKSFSILRTGEWNF